MERPFILSLNTALVFDNEKDEPTANAASILQRDIHKTIGDSDGPRNVIRIMAPNAALSDESWTIEITSDEIKVDYADSLGCVYALLFISGTFLHVSPFWYWNDQCFTKQHNIPILPGTWRSPEYVTRFRGWFVNDEVLVENWKAAPENTESWAMIFEALLRCGGNMTIPGTDNNSRAYRALAARMGLRITHHHAEPLGAEMFLRKFPGQSPSYSRNGQLFEKLWEEAILAQKNYRVIWNLGFRGQGDYPFWHDDPEYTAEERRGELISRVIQRQYEILKKYIDNPVCCVNVYGEFAALYRARNLRLPAGVITVWADNGFGCMVSRRQGNSNPRIPSLPAAKDTGKHGIYFHCSFHDLQASNHLTMSPNPAEFLSAELKKALDAGACEYWIINCGSVKPHVHTLDMAAEMWRNGCMDIAAWRLRYVQTYYGKENAEGIAAVFSEFASCTARYGPNDDDRAGEELWHHPVREFLCRWMGGDTENCEESLVWLTGNAPFSKQVKTLETICRESLPKWEKLFEKCAALRLTLSADSCRLFDDSIFLQTRLHLTGAAGTLAFCESFSAFASGSMAAAFQYADKSRSCYVQSVKALSDAEHGKWAGYYSGDCLTDVRLTASCLEALVSYLRVLGDGPDFHRWEREYLRPAAESKVMLLSSKQRALSNTDLAARLKAVWQ